MQLLRVVVEHETSFLDKYFFYLSKNEKKIEKGVRVSIKFGYQNLVGYVVDSSFINKTKEKLEEEKGFKFKYIKDVIDKTPILDESLNEIAYLMQKEYFAPLISCFKTMLPKSLKPKSNTKENSKKIKMVYLNEKKENKDLTFKQLELYNFLRKKKKVPLKEIAHKSHLLNKLIQKGLVFKKEEEIYRQTSFLKGDHNLKKHTLTKRQKEIYNKILENKNNTHLLKGVTGSGKSEIYFHLAKHFLDNNQGVILLVPEIILTSQIASKFKFHFKDRLALLHSGLSDGERYDEYRRIKKGEATIVIGTRSAIFAPIKNLKLIIIDEEHSSSYKQDKVPFYHASFIAQKRREQIKGTLLLGSATPLIDSEIRAKKDLYIKHNLNERVAKDISLPKSSIIDMKDENSAYLSSYLKNKINEKLAKKEQVILLLNKRGYAPFIRCKACMHVFKCKDCDVGMNYHNFDHKLKCHYCGKEEILREKCPECGNNSIEKIGFGTQKLEEILNKEFSSVSISRMDHDSTRKKDSHHKFIEEMLNNKIDILIGTQMVAKGLDFPNVTLVGVISGDVGMNSNDFRGGERTFQLVVQVLGRAGRKDKKGEAIIQTFDRENKILNLASKQNYDQFAKEEIEYRKKLKYPPFYSLLYFEVRERDFLRGDKLILLAKKYLTQFKTNHFIVLGPSVPYLKKIGNKYRHRIMIKYKDKDKAYKIINDLKNHLYKFGAKDLFVYVDPFSDV